MPISICGSSLAAKIARRSSVVTGRTSRAGNRIAGDAAAEIAELAGGIPAAFAEEVDVGDEFAAFVAAQRADVGDQPAVADDHLDLAADLAGHRDRRVGMRLQRRRAALASMRICEPEPAISTTLPIRG